MQRSSQERIQCQGRVIHAKLFEPEKAFRTKFSVSLNIHTTSYRTGEVRLKLAARFYVAANENPP